MGWRDQLLKKGKDIVGRALPKSKSKLVKDKTGTIKGVKPLSGNVPWYVGAGGKDPKKRAEIVKTWKQVQTNKEIKKAEEAVKTGKEKLKNMVGAGRATEFKDYKGKGTGRHFRTGSN